MKICINKYVCLSKKKKILNINFTQLDGQSRHIQCLIFLLNWLKESFLRGFLTEGTRVENNDNLGFQDHTKQLFFFPLQTPESSLECSNLPHKVI